MRIIRGVLLAASLSWASLVVTSAATASPGPANDALPFPGRGLGLVVGAADDATLFDLLREHYAVSANAALTLAGISGATVTLQRQTAGGFLDVPSGDPGISPHLNPRVTQPNGGGFYFWVVSPGTYRVRVSAAGYRPATSAPMASPGADRLDVKMTPDCPPGHHPVYDSMYGASPSGAYPGWYPGLVPGAAPTCAADDAGAAGAGDRPDPADGGADSSGASAGGGGAGSATADSGAHTPPPPRATLAAPRSVLRVDRRGRIVVPCRFTVVGSAMRCRVTIRATGRPGALGRATRSLVGASASVRLQLSAGARRAVRRAHRRGVPVTVTTEGLSGGGARLVAQTTTARLRLAS